MCIKYYWNISVPDYLVKQIWYYLLPPFFFLIYLTHLMLVFLLFFKNVIYFIIWGATPTACIRSQGGDWTHSTAVTVPDVYPAAPPGNPSIALFTNFIKYFIIFNCLINWIAEGICFSKHINIYILWRTETNMKPKLIIIEDYFSTTEIKTWDTLFFPEK